MQQDLLDPSELFDAVQRCIVDKTSAIVMAEAGNAFAHATGWLHFREAKRYRASMMVGSIGHMCAGVIGAALVHGKAVVLTGDGAMLCFNEISTAVQHQIAAVWIVLNDAGYNSCIAGQSARGLDAGGLDIPRVDFEQYARAMGAQGVRVCGTAGLDAALDLAMQATGPFVVDAWIRPGESPLRGRFAQFYAPTSEQEKA
ncbi:MAG TPA: thiamine pyrophosphate-dependent enzyme [Polyangiaceae bacterium]|jgi:acetolactate synthase-1/2/3 large subunit